MKSILALFFIVAIFSYSCVVGARHDVYVPTPVEVEMVPVIIYEQPVYYTPPIMVMYPYDYFMYVPNGLYVDLVFFHNGIRRVEHWNHGGARMTHARVPGWHRNYRVSRPALTQHQQRTKPAERIITPHQPRAAYAAQPPAVQRPDIKTHTTPPPVQHQNQTPHNQSAPAMKQPPTQQPQLPVAKQPPTRRPQPPAVKQPQTQKPQAPAMRQPSQTPRAPAKKAAPEPRKNEKQ